MKKGGPSSTPATSTSVSVETCSKETKCAYTGPCPFSNQIERLGLLIRSCAQNKDLEGGITRISRLLRECLKNCFAPKMNSSLCSPNSREQGGTKAGTQLKTT